MFNSIRTVVFNCFFFLARLFYFELDVRCEGDEEQDVGNDKTILLKRQRSL